MHRYSMVLALLFSVAAPIRSARAATIAVPYSVTGSIYSTDLGGALAGSFNAIQTIYYQGSGLLTLTHGPIQLVSGSQSVLTNILVLGAFNLTGMNTTSVTGFGSLASNGIATMMVARINTGGYIHCFDLTALGCQVFVMFPASVMLPQTGSVSFQLLAGSLGVGQPPLNFTVLGGNVGGSATTTTWTFSEIAGRHIVPEPTTGSLVSLGMLGLAMIVKSKKARVRIFSHRRAQDR